jgi:Zn-finger protein
MDSRTGGRSQEGEWNCRACVLIHRPEVAAMIMDALLSGEAPASAWKRLERLL